MRRYPTTETVDAVIIGTGAGGAPMMAVLAEAGLSVVALEAGKWHAPASHTPDEEQAGDIYWLEERLSDGKNPQPFGGNNSGTGVGGSTLHFGAFMPRLDARDMTLHTETGQGRDWPIRYEALLPYLIKVEEDIGVSGPAAYPWDPTRRYAFPPPQRNEAALAMMRGCDAIGLKSADGPVALITTKQGAREACVGCGACHQGCRNQAKSSADVTYIPRALAAGAEIRAECFAHDFKRDSRGRITGVIYRQGGKDVMQRCQRVILCAGAVETARLLLHTGLANRSDQVGRNYMAHVSTQVWGTVDHVTRPNKGYPSLAISEDMIRPKDADFVGGYLIQSLGMMPMTWATNVVRGRGYWGEKLTRYLRDYNFAIGLGAHGECLPSQENRVILSDETGRAGMPKPLITLSYGCNEKALHRHAGLWMTRIAEAAGARDIWTSERSAHMMGTCRMGTDPDDAVVDEWGRSFDIENLWISDHSIFPSATCANPAAPIMALSLRAADKILGRAPLN